MVRVRPRVEGRGLEGCSGSSKNDIIADVIHWPESLPVPPRRLAGCKRGTDEDFMEGLRGR